METQGWPLYAARRGGGTVYAVVGWENRTSRGGRVAIGVEIGPAVDDAPAIELGSGVTFTGEYPQACVVAFGEAS